MAITALFRSSGWLLPAQLISLFLLSAQATASSEKSCCIECRDSAVAQRSQDNVWLISSREFYRLKDETSETRHLNFWRHEHQGGWKKVREEDFFSAKLDPMPTTFYVHGNRVTEPMAFDEALWIHQRLFHPLHDQTARRLVMWSWPSAQNSARPLVDVRSKYGRTPAASKQLASVLDRLSPASPTSLIGYSFGARIITGALDRLDIGDLPARANQVLPPRYNVVLLGAAMNEKALTTGGEHDQAPARMAKLLLVNNRCDRVLKAYWRMHCGRGGPGALGYKGLPGGPIALVSSGAEIVELQAGPYLGQGHEIQNYLGSRTVNDRVREVLFSSVNSSDGPAP